MNRFIIVDGLPYLYADGKAYSCRFDESGFTVGTEVEMASVPEATFTELSIMAQCAGHLDSIGSEHKNGIAEMSLSELKDYAKEHGIKVGSARTKAEIMEVIKAAEEQG